MSEVEQSTKAVNPEELQGWNSNIAVKVQKSKNKNKKRPHVAAKQNECVNKAEATAAAGGASPDAKESPPDKCHKTITTLPNDDLEADCSKDCVRMEIATAGQDASLDVSSSVKECEGEKQQPEFSDDSLTAPEDAEQTNYAKDAKYETATEEANQCESEDTKQENIVGITQQEKEIKNVEQGEEMAEKAQHINKIEEQKRASSENIAMDSLTKETNQTNVTVCAATDKEKTFENAEETASPGCLAENVEDVEAEKPAVDGVEAGQKAEASRQEGEISDNGEPQKCLEGSELDTAGMVKESEKLAVDEASKEDAPAVVDSSTATTDAESENTDSKEDVVTGVDTKTATDAESEKEAMDAETDSKKQVVTDIDSKTMTTESEKGLVTPGIDSKKEVAADIDSTNAKTNTESGKKFGADEQEQKAVDDTRQRKSADAVTSDKVVIDSKTEMSKNTETEQVDRIAEQDKEIVPDNEPERAGEDAKMKRTPENAQTEVGTDKLEKATEGVETGELVQNDKAKVTEGTAQGSPQASSKQEGTEGKEETLATAPSDNKGKNTDRTVSKKQQRALKKREKNEHKQAAKEKKKADTQALLAQEMTGVTKQDRKAEETKQEKATDGESSPWMTIDDDSSSGARPKQDYAHNKGNKQLQSQKGGMGERSSKEPKEGGRQHQSGKRNQMHQSTLSHFKKAEESTAPKHADQSEKGKGAETNKTPDARQDSQHPRSHDGSHNGARGQDRSSRNSQDGNKHMGDRDASKSGSKRGFSGQADKGQKEVNSQKGGRKDKTSNGGKNRGPQADRRDESAERGEPFELLEIKGDLFQCPPDDAMAHCVSEDLAMGKGIAVLFKQCFGGVGQLRAQEKKVGEVATLFRDGNYVYYLITKRCYNHKPTLQTVRDSLISMRTHMMENKVTSLSMPTIGCGLDGLDWGAVSDIIKEVFRGTGIRITIYYK